MTDAVTIQGTRVVFADRIARVDVRIEGGLITGLDVARDGARKIDGRGMILAPALVDAHGDAFEHAMMPRPGVRFGTHAALLEADRQLAANGIATAYHALTLGWEPGLRSIETGTEVISAITELAPRLTVEHRVQLRWETFCLEAEPLIAAALKGPLTPSVAFNDHTSMAVLHPSVRLQDRPFEFDPAFPVTDLNGAAFAAKIAPRAARSNLSTDAFTALVQRMWDRRAEVPDAIARVAALARKAGAPMLSHDDSQLETRDFYRGHGAMVAEFPMTIAVAEHARANGDAILFGAPNATRGGSHLGSPSAADMVARRLCDGLASDYFYPSMLAGIAQLMATGAGSLPQLWPLVSGGPAAAMGLADRGRIEPGLRADLVLLDWPSGGVPVVRQTLVAGRSAYAAQPTGA